MARNRPGSAPAAADLRHMHDAGDHPPVVYSPGTGLLTGQTRLDRRPRFVRQPEQRHTSLLPIQTPVNHEILHPSKG